MTGDLRPVLRVGSLAYFDSLGGAVPCKVISIFLVRGTPHVRVKFTATRGAFKRGEGWTAFSHNVVPRAAFHKRRYGARIGYYTVEVSK